jgi:hypothetical protein
MNLCTQRNKYRAAKTDSVIDLTQKHTSNKDNGSAVKRIRIKLRELEDEGKECRDKKKGTVNLCAQNNWDMCRSGGLMKLVDAEQPGCPVRRDPLDNPTLGRLGQQQGTCSWATIDADRLGCQP